MTPIRTVKLPNLLQRRCNSFPETLKECEVALWDALALELGDDFERAKKHYAVSHEQPGCSILWSKARLLYVDETG